MMSAISQQLEPYTDAILLANVAATLFMTGLIWFVQIVHYPLFHRVPAAEFTGYERDHQRLTTFVVAPPMLCELVTSIMLVASPPPGVSPETLWTALGLVLVIWGSTIGLQVPEHQRLAKNFSAAAHRRLVHSNWVRTTAWTARAVFVMRMLHHQLS